MNTIGSKLFEEIRTDKTNKSGQTSLEYTISIRTEERI